MPKQTELYEALQIADTPSERRDLALELLALSNSRQYIDDCLRILRSSSVIETLNDSHRPILREKALYYYEDGKRDKAGMIREALTRLLVEIAHPEDLDIYKLGVDTYYLQPVHDVAQNLRAVALAGIAPIDRSLACLYATKFLGDEHSSVFNCEPAMTALDVLVNVDMLLPIYQFLLKDGLHMAQSRRAELTGKALESLGKNFPVSLYLQLIDLYQAIDNPVASMGIITYITSNRRSDLYDALENLIQETRDTDLRRFGLVTMSAERDDELTERLLRTARLCPLSDVPLYIEAIEVCAHHDRDDTLDMLQKRIK